LTTALRIGPVLLLLATLATTGAERPANDMNMLSWLSGDWELRNGETYTEEHWTAPLGGTMIGMGRTTARNKTVYFEHLRIESRADGVYYVAQPQGQAPTEFRAIELDANHVVFSNPEHDFPKRIIYRKNADGSVTARVEGDVHSKEKSEEYPYRRMRISSEVMNETSRYLSSVLPSVLHDVFRAGSAS